LIDATTRLLCFEENDTVKYRHQGYNTCFYSTVGTNELSVQPKNRILIYPNPSSNFISIGEVADIITSYNIFDINGKSIIHSAKDYDNNRLTINISDLPQGIYYIKIQSLKQTYHEKFIKVD
jgi:hypothetical protein